MIRSLRALAIDAFEIAGLLAIDAAFKALEVVTAPAEKTLDHWAAWSDELGWRS